MLSSNGGGGNVSVLSVEDEFKYTSKSIKTTVGP